MDSVSKNPNEFPGHFFGYGPAIDTDLNRRFKRVLTSSESAEIAVFRFMRLYRFSQEEGLRLLLHAADMVKGRSRRPAS